MAEAQSLNHRLNNFDFLRLLAASMVIFSHSFDLIAPSDVTMTNGEPLRVLTDGQMSFGSLGVAIFFCLSGFLITQSLFRSNSYKTYFIKRFLRIFPALILDLLIAVFIWGAIVTSLSLYDYFTNPLTFRYLLNVGLYNISYVLPGVFENNIYGNTVNGSLWTLPYEFTCYFGIAILYYFFILKNKYIYTIFYLMCLAVGFFILNTQFHTATIPYTNISFVPLFTLSAYFGAGALFCHFQDKIEYNVGIAAVLLLVLIIGSHFHLMDYFNYLCLPYIVFWFVFERRIPVQNAGKFGDFSYGIYIYGFPVQQTIIHFAGAALNVSEMIVLSFIFTIPLAVFSWFAVEKKALKLKKVIAKPSAVF